MRREPAYLLNARLSRKGFLKTAQLELTHRCNLRCVHCLRDNRATPLLSTEEWIRVLGELAELGCMAVTFTGGEPSTRPDLLTLIHEASRRGMAVSLLSNGQLLDETFFAGARGSRLSFLRVSLYGATARTHDRYTRSPGSFQKACRALLLAKEAGIEARVAYFLFRGNLKELEAARSFAAKHDLPFATDFVLQRTDRRRISQSRLSLNSEGVAFAERLNPVYHAPHNQNRRTVVKNCFMGKLVLGINPDGTVFPCPSLRFPVGNVRDDSLVSIWRESPRLMLFRSMETGAHAYCNECPLIEKCHLCAGDNHRHTGSLFRPDQRHCQLTYSLFGMNQATKEGMKDLLPPPLISCRHEEHKIQESAGMVRHG